MSNGKTHEEGGEVVSSNCESHFNYILKRYGNLWTKIISKENIKSAIIKACKNNGRMSPAKRRSIDYIKENLDLTVVQVQKLLINREYKTSPYHIYPLFDPKLRMIYSLPFMIDRIIHHALLNILEPLWDSLMISDSYACRKGKGQHKAAMRCMEFTRKYKYCAQLDISQFYVNINHKVLKRVIRKKIKDKIVLETLDEIIDSISTRNTNIRLLKRLKRKGVSCDGLDISIQKLLTSKQFDNNERAGLPIGSYTSQWFGNLFMNELDMFVKHKLKCKAYIRFCDDFVLFSNNKEELKQWANSLEEFLKVNLHLLLSKKQVFPTAQGVDFVGYRYFPEGYILLRKRTAKRIRRRLKSLTIRLKEGKITLEKARGQLASAQGWMKWAKSYNFRKAIDFMNIQQEVENFAQI